MENFFQRIISLFFSEKCFEEFFIRLNFLDVPCLKETVSKALGTGIIIGSTLVKFPQILKIINAKSSEGISFAGVLLELLAVTSAASYSFAKKYPFSSWGESIFLLVETAIIGFLVLMYSGPKRQAYSFAVCYSLIAYCLFSGIVPISYLWSLQMANVPVVVVGKMIQALKNYQNGHTGQLSAITIFLLFLGACARIFTSVQETGDSAIIVTFVVASLANGILAGQVLYYWEATSRFLAAKAKKKE